MFAVMNAAPRVPIDDSLVGMGLAIAGWFALAPVFVRIGARVPRIPRRPWMIRVLQATCMVNGAALVGWIVVIESHLLQLFVRRPAPPATRAIPGRS